MSASYPVRVDAVLDGHLSRWLWLIKWVLALARGTRMRWSGQVRPKSTFRLLGPVITWLGIRQEQRIWTSLKKHVEAAQLPTA
jgi:hypothetical protein